MLKSILHLVAALAVASALSLFNCSTAHADGLKLAETLYQQTRYDDALLLLLKGVHKGGAVQHLIGKCYYRQEKFQLAAEAFERAVSSEPTNAYYQDWLGRAYGRIAENAPRLKAFSYALKTRASFEKAVGLAPDNVEAIMDLFEYYLQAPAFLGGGRDKALRLSDRLASLDPSVYHAALARLAEEGKDFAVAEKELRQAIALASNKVDRMIDLGKFLARQGRLQESEKVFLDAEQLAPDEPELLFEWASTYLEAGWKTTTARQLLDRYLKMDLTADVPPRFEAERLYKQALSSMHDHAEWVEQGEAAPAG